MITTFLHEFELLSLPVKHNLKAQSLQFMIIAAFATEIFHFEVVLAKHVEL